MKSITVRLFYPNKGLMEGQIHGNQLVAIANVRPKSVISKSVRPRMSRELAERRSVGDKNALRFNGTAFLASLKK